ncbi:hypothetical protein LSCM1_02490 [Leishmania martiniquensis]|uniref:Transcription factor Iwr1 domain-containing protein n=1 Tax=Leishmania martiniquensis TaxID=1580590 RepID=A0A836GPB7_9TRYP|nr:hypothetical protein LSCM1_02490 [Leishmania martiniquensis]
MNLSPCGGGTPQTRVYLKVSRKRGRDGFLEEANPPTHVRVQWDSAEMGTLPLVLQPVISSRTRLVFRRLPRIEMERSTRKGQVPAPRESAKQQAQKSCSQVERLTATAQCVVIECDDSLSSADVSAPAMELFILDSKATESDAMVEAFGEFAITEDDAPGGTRVRLKRGRGEEDEQLPCYFLTPLRRTSSVGDHSIAVTDPASSSSRWGSVEVDEDGAMWKLLQKYDEVLCLEDRADAMADLYCYPDHRKDDEYDSNAEDFSGNDYPDDADDRSDVSARRSDQEPSDVSTGRPRGGVASRDTYGIFCEEDYTERSLSSGWSSSG